MSEQRTQLFQAHQKAQAKFVSFSQWTMPIHYGSQIEEHHSVRQRAGMFDVSHMTIVDIKGSQAKAYLQNLLANDVAKLVTVGQALYSAMLNDQGGILDDLVVYSLESGYRTVVNCATREADLKWMNAQAKAFDVEIIERDDLSMLAVQGPKAVSLIASLIKADARTRFTSMKAFHAITVDDWFIAKTGYTGEEGVEIILPHAQIEPLWNQLLDKDCQPCGLGARDTLRLEAGLNLYGQDMTEANHPLESGMAWTIAWEPADRNFLGRAALEHIRQQKNYRKQWGVILLGKGILRSGCLLYDAPDGQVIGEVTSGTFSPTLERSIGIARLSIASADHAYVDMRGKKQQVRFNRLPFVKQGKIVWQDEYLAR